MRTVRILIYVFVLICLFSFVDYSQNATTKPDFSGVWLLDKKKSHIEDGFWNDELRIIHKEPELEVVFSGSLKGEKKSATATFYTDKRGEMTSPYFYFPDEAVKSVTYWKGNSLIRKFSKSEISDLSQVVNNNSKAKGKTNLFTTETYSLSKDGKKLTIKVDRMSQIFISPAMPIEGRIIQEFVFIKQ